MRYLQVFKHKQIKKLQEVFSTCVVPCRSRAEVEPPLPETPPAPAPAPPRVDELEPGSQRQYSLDDFELIRVIGRGSYAKVRVIKKTMYYISISPPFHFYEVQF